MWGVGGGGPDTFDDSFTSTTCLYLSPSRLCVIKLLSDPVSRLEGGRRREVLWYFGSCISAVTVSLSGPRKLFKGVTTATSGVLARFPWLFPVRNSFASYGASAVARTSDRGHVAEASNQVYRSGGVSIRVSKETFLPLNVQPVFSF